VRVGGIKMLLNPHVREELEELEGVLSSLMLKHKALEDAKNSLNPLSGVGEELLDIEIVLDHEVPKTVIIRI